MRLVVAIRTETWVTPSGTEASSPSPAAAAASAALSAGLKKAAAAAAAARKVAVKEAVKFTLLEMAPLKLSDAQRVLDRHGDWDNEDYPWAYYRRDEARTQPLRALVRHRASPAA